MKDLTPELKAILDKLVALCCESMVPGNELDAAAVERLVSSLKTNGWERHTADRRPLSAILEQMTLSRCRDEAMHHPAQLKGITSQIEKAYDKVAWDSSMPASERSAGDRSDNQASPPRTRP